MDQVIKNLVHFFIRLRIIILLPVLGSFFGGLILLYLGVHDLSLAFSDIWYAGKETLREKVVQEAIIQILESVDAFLFAIVLLIFAYGVLIVFVLKEQHYDQANLPNWMKIGGIGKLKKTLAQVVVVSLFVVFAHTVLDSGADFSWNLLVIPISILLLSLGLKFLGLDEE